MDDFIDPPFDFRLEAGRAGGSRIEIAPGDIKADLDKFFNIDERPFWLVESFICAHLHEPDSFSHYGENTILMPVWVAAVNDAHAYLESITDPLRAGEAWSQQGYTELANEFKIKPATTLAGFKELLDQLNEEAVSWSNLYRNVFILGI